MRKLWVAFVIAGVMAVWSPPASAGTIYDNGTPDYSTGFISDSQNSSYSYMNVLYVAYDYFTLTSPSKITGMEWWGFYAPSILPPDIGGFLPGNTPPAGGDIFKYDIRLSNGPPIGEEITNGTLSGLSRADTGTSQISYSSEMYEYDATSDISLPAGTYFLSIYDTASNPGNAFAWATSKAITYDPTYDAWYLNWTSQSWGGSFNVGLAFNLTGEPVPEPISMIFFGTGLVAVGGYVSRRRLLRKA